MVKSNDLKYAEDQLTQEEAIAFAEQDMAKEWTDEQIVRFQLFQKRLAMDFGKFHAAMEVVLKRPVFTHEFAYRENLVKEYLGEKPMPSLNEIIELIPAEKRIIFNL